MLTKKTTGKKQRGSSDLDDDSLFEIDIPIKKKPVLTKKTASKKKRVRRKPKAKY